MATARPLPASGEIFLDARGADRALRVSWHYDTDMVVLSLWRDNVCSNCAASADGRPSTCCFEASDAFTCSPAMMWALRSDWRDGLGVYDRWTTPACVERSKGGNRTPGWCISTSCSTGWHRPAP